MHDKISPSISQIKDHYFEDLKKKAAFSKNLSARKIRYKKRLVAAVPYLRTPDKSSETLFVYSMLLKQTQVTTQFLNPFKNKNLESKRLKLLQLTNDLVDELEKDLAKETNFGDDEKPLDESYWDASELFFEFALHSFKNYSFLKTITMMLEESPEFIEPLLNYLNELQMNSITNPTEKTE
ncbi:MAG: hypothetical protein EBU90_01685 [Proteobacteria bacterium]|nr:hypothetical protein [Pseudomonadota bacterium]